MQENYSKNCIINSNGTLEHDCSMGENSYFYGRFNGHTWIGDNSFIEAILLFNNLSKLKKIALLMPTFYK